MTPAVLQAPAQGRNIEARLQWMAERGGITRIAIGAFYEPARLRGAMEEILRLGIDADDFLLVGSPVETLAGAEMAEALRTEPGLTERLRGADAAGCLLGEADRTGALIEGGAGSLGQAIRSHVENGGVVALVRTATPALQDRCLRVLLRYSRHTVHSQESSS